MNKSGIYTITNLTNGKCYVGSAVNFKARWWEHRKALVMLRHHSPALQRDYDQYGVEAFEFTMLLLCAREHLIFYEQRALDVLKPKYNCCKVAGSQLGMKHSAKSRAIMSAKALLRGPQSPEVVRKRTAPLIGRKRPPEVIAKYAASLSKRKQTPADLARLAMMRARRGPYTDERRAKVSASLLGNKRTLGYKHTPETRAKLSASKRGKPKSPEWRAAISAGLKGRVFSPEQCRNISLGKTNPSPESRLKMRLAKLGRKLTPEHRAKIGAATRKRYASIAQLAVPFVHSAGSSAQISASPSA